MPFATCVTHNMPCVVAHSRKSIFTTSEKKTKSSRSETRWKVTQKIQVCGRLKQVRRQRDRVDNLKRLTKKKRIVLQKKKLINTYYDSNINTVAE